MIVVFVRGGGVVIGSTYFMLFIVGAADFIRCSVRIGSAISLAAPLGLSESVVTDLVLDVVAVI